MLVLGLCFRVGGALGVMFSVKGLGLRVYGSGFRVHQQSRVSGLGITLIFRVADGDNQDKRVLFFHPVV